MSGLFDSIRAVTPGRGRSCFRSQGDGRNGEAAETTGEKSPSVEMSLSDMYMLCMDKLPNDTVPALRERQAQQLRREITQAAIKRFLNAGFERTTIDEIAEDCGVSRRTVFRHFPTKEDILLTWPLSWAESLGAKVAARSGTEPALTCLRVVLLDFVNSRLARTPHLFAFIRLIQGTVSLRSRSHEVTDAWERALTNGLVAHERQDAHLAPMAVAVAMAAARLGCRRWLEADASQPLAHYIDGAFQELPLIISDQPSGTSAPK